MKMLDQMSKKERKTYYASFRGDWNGVNPVTKVIESKKAYKRHDKHKSNAYAY